MSDQIKNKGWLVTLSGTGINLALGVLYAWSVVAAAITAKVQAGEWDWGMDAINDPYAVAVLMFAVMMVPAGRLLDRLGPRLTATIGGVLVGGGFLVCAFTTSWIAWVLGFGVMAGAGIGAAYAAATPAAVKWFPASKTGLIAGLVVAGFGLASAYIAPLATSLMGSIGLDQTMLYFGIGFLVIVVFFAQMLSVPPAGYVPAEPRAAAKGDAAQTAPASEDFAWKEMIKTPTFWILWVIFFVGAGAGLMVISFAAKLAKASFAENAWIAVTVLAVGNAAGRVISGILSDKIGRKATLTIMLVFQALLIFGLMYVPTDSAAIILAVATFIGFNYGSNLTLFPAATKDFFGAKGLGFNYGILFSAWGVGGAVLSRVSKMLVARSDGDLTHSCIMAGSLLVLGALLTLLIRAPKKKAAQAVTPAKPAESNA